MRGATLDMQNTKKYADQRDLEFQNAIRLRRPTQPKRKKDYADQRSRELQSTKRLRRQRSPELQWYTPTNGWRTLRRNVFREKKSAAAAQVACFLTLCFVGFLGLWHIERPRVQVFMSHCVVHRIPTRLSWTGVRGPSENHDVFFFRGTGTGPLWILMPTKLFHNEGAWPDHSCVFAMCRQTCSWWSCWSRLTCWFFQFPFLHMLFPNPTRNQTSCHGTTFALNFSLLCVCAASPYQSKLAEEQFPYQQIVTSKNIPNTMKIQPISLENV